MFLIRPHRKWLGLISLMPAIAMIFTDQAVLPVALPTIQTQLNASTLALWWSINSYLLVSAILLLSGGKLGDRIGYRRVFLWGMCIFALASFLCGLSFNIGWLIGARALQGVGAALMVPATSPLIMSLFPQKERGKAVGLNVSAGSLFLIAAPFIGGYFTEVLSWRWIFYINLPLAALGFILVLLLIPPSPKGGEKFDPWGFSFFAICGSCLITLIMQESMWGWTSLIPLILGALSLVSGLLLFWREKRSRHPFIDLSLFRHPIYKAITISIFATQFVLMITIYRAIFFQEGLNWSPLKSGSILCLTSLPVFFMSPVGGWLADRFGSKAPLSIGFSLLIGSFFWMAFFVQHTLGMILIGLFAFGLGIPLILTPSYSSAMGVVPQKKAGLAFGVLATVRAFSASLGVAIIGSFASHMQIRSFKTLTAEKNLVSTTPPIIEQLLKESQIQAFFLTHLALGLSLLIAFIFVLVLYHRKTSSHPPITPAEGWD